MTLITPAVDTIRLTFLQHFVVIVAYKLGVNTAFCA